MDELQFELDEDKAAQNFAKHSVSFLAPRYSPARSSRGSMIKRTAASRGS
jgi:uncharacterized DUF497 family protein